MSDDSAGFDLLFSRYVSFRFVFFFVGMFKEGGSRVSRKGSCIVIIANNEPWPRPIMTIRRAPSPTRGCRIGRVHMRARIVVYARTIKTYVFIKYLLDTSYGVIKLL